MVVRAAERAAWAGVALEEQAELGSPIPPARGQYGLVLLHKEVGSLSLPS